MGFGYTPIHTMQASNGTSTAISRGDRSASFSFTLLSSGLKITRCSAGSRYIAATMTPAVAIVAATGYVRNVPSSTRNSPTNPFVAGSPIEDSERSEEHTSELQSHSDLVCRLLLEKKK